uniref:Uncharacterized protein n=1 Tax=Arundo donax TaxID=35708 RepID=A0A0A8ZAR0_ARUDO
MTPSPHNPIIQLNTIILNVLVIIINIHDLRENVKTFFFSILTRSMELAPQLSIF